MRRVIVLFFLAAGVSSCNDSDGNNANSLTGKSGSLARFAVTPTHLYTVDDESLNVYQIRENGGVEKINSAFLGPGVETIFAKEQWLYIGTNEAMKIYNITNPSSPHFVSSYSHFVACDPVVVQDTLAFVTVRTTNCRAANFNTLDVINIRDPQDPVLLSTYTLESPYGLGVDGDMLFVCEGEYGLKVLDISDPFNVTQIAAYTDVDAYDVIPDDGVLILTGKDGIVQYDYSGGEAIRKLSIIPVQP